MSAGVFIVFVTTACGWLVTFKWSGMRRVMNNFVDDSTIFGGPVNSGPLPKSHRKKLFKDVSIV